MEVADTKLQAIARLVSNSGNRGIRGMHRSSFVFSLNVEIAIIL